MSPYDCYNGQGGQLRTYWNGWQIDYATLEKCPPSRPAFVGTQLLSWFEAEEYCQEKYNSHLATIKSQLDRDLAQALCRSLGNSGQCWIGLYHHDAQSTWKWIDGADLDYGFNADGTPKTGADPWDSGEPNYDSEDCVQLNHLYDWNDISCWTFNYPICNSNITTFEPTATLSTSPTSPTQPPTKYPTTGELQQCLNRNRTIHAWYHAGSIDLTNNLWIDLSGNDNNGKIDDNTGIELFDGTDTSIAELYLNGEPVIVGTYQTKISFDVQLNPFNHTIFNLCKYRLYGQYKGRILQSNEENGIYGFHSGRAGVAYENGWITDEDGGIIGEHWIVSSQQNDLYRANGIDYTQSAAGFSVQQSLSINQGLLGDEYSDFACAEIIIINEKLLLPEIQCIEQYLFNKYSLSTGIIVFNYSYA